MSSDKAKLIQIGLGSIDAGIRSLEKGLRSEQDAQVLLEDIRGTRELWKLKLQKFTQHDPLERLPLEVFQIILEQLKPADWNRMILVSHNWFRAVAPRILLSGIWFGCPKLAKFTAFLKSRKKMCQRLGNEYPLKILKLVGPPAKGRKYLKELSKYRLIVYQLELSVASEQDITSNLSDDSTGNLQLLLRDLRKLHLKTDSVKSIQDFYTVLSHVKENLDTLLLTFRRADSDILEKHLPQVGANIFSKLTSLDLAFRPTKGGFTPAYKRLMKQFIVYNIFPNLANLRLEAGPITKRQLEAVVNYSVTLKSLVLVGTPLFSSSDAVAILADAKAELTTFSLCSTKPDSRVIAPLSDDPHLLDTKINLASLRRLRLSYTTLSDQGLMNILNAAHNLASITLSYNPSMNFQKGSFSFTHMLENCPHLAFLEINGSASFTNSSCGMLKEALITTGVSKSMQTIQLKQTKVTEEYVKKAFMTEPMLKCNLEALPSDYVIEFEGCIKATVQSE